MAKRIAKKNAGPKPTVKKRVTKSAAGRGASFNEQDPKRRLGNFAGAGEHPRQGGRTSGIVGQTKKRNHTDRAKAKKK
jgi:hypothetical protein